MTAPPAPLEWHPAYRDKTDLLDWLDDPTQYPVVQVPLMGYPRIRLADLPIVSGTIEVHTLTKQRAQGLAPYIGRPFIYRWTVATDQLGRSIAGESRIEYIDDHGYYLGWDREPSRNGHAPVGPAGQRGVT